MEMLRPAGLVNNNQNPFGCNCKSGYTGMPTQPNSGVMAYPQGTYYSGDCACIPTSSMSQLVNPSNILALKQISPAPQTNSSNSGGNNIMNMQNFYPVSNNEVSLPNNISAHIQTNSSTSKDNNIMNTQSSTNTTASANSSSPVAPIQNLMNNWFAWGVQPTNAAGNEPTNTKAALNPMTNQWQFFPSQNTASANSTSTTNPTSQAQTALSNATSTASANASPQASNGLSEVAQEFEKAIDSIFGSISNFVKKLS